MEKLWHFRLNDENHTVRVDEDWRLVRLIYFDNELIYKESFWESRKKTFVDLQLEGEVIICRFKENDFNFCIQEEGRFSQRLKLYINGLDVDKVTEFYNNNYQKLDVTQYTYDPQENDTKYTSSPNTHTWFKDIIVPLAVALLGGGGIVGLVRGCQELTPSKPTDNSQQLALNNSACSLRSGVYKASVTRNQGLGLRENPEEKDTIKQRLSFNQEIIVSEKSKDGKWLYVCLEGTDTKGWILGKYTKQIK
ncbi:hypothetical protein NIES2101_41535 [Calothrix sp. HK-06]|nr:hypothetical protein NIES2101_41535 [Calothrix sp. HK-06]